MSAATIFDVAARAGVSIKSVSRVVNNEPNVSDKLRAKVIQACADLNYSPNISARSMAGSKSWLLISLNDRDLTCKNWESERGNTWIDRMLFGAMMACEAAGYHFMMELVSLETDQLERRIFEILNTFRPDGLILTPPNSESSAILNILETRRLPFVRIGADDGRAGIQVRMDDFAAAGDATRHLLALGHRRIGMICGSPRFIVSHQREQGYRAALRDARIAADPAWLQPGDFSFESGERGTAALLALPEPPSAIIANNDEMALAALKTARTCGLSVPGDLSIISFDDGAGVKLSTPPITSIRQPVSEMASTAIDALVTAVRDGGLASGHHVIAHQLVIRESSAPPRGARSSASALAAASAG